MKTSQVALLVSSHAGAPVLVEFVSEDSEINWVEVAVHGGEKNLIACLFEYRAQLENEENQFADYVEELLSHPFLRKKIQRQGVQWFKSRIKIHQYQQAERKAMQFIVDYAYKIFLTQPHQRDFVLTTSTHQVRVRVFESA